MWSHRQGLMTGAFDVGDLHLRVVLSFLYFSLQSSSLLFSFFLFVVLSTMRCKERPKGQMSLRICINFSFLHPAHFGFLLRPHGQNSFQFQCPFYIQPPFILFYDCKDQNPVTHFFFAKNQ
eukprot:TRINITY_DN6281_c1_g1_i1.p1 TRINITY_DN6281_c1_g1~~TRINITY_DN6281_c1_g1_i1.p1  ORF type:complete len:121 (-),score=9.54 TRINITY_DN6281_c1_g1_i1:216-578(-)